MSTHAGFVPISGVHPDPHIVHIGLAGSPLELSTQLGGDIHHDQVMRPGCAHHREYLAVAIFALVVRLTLHGQVILGGDVGSGIGLRGHGALRGIE